MPYFFGDQWNRFCADHAKAIRERDAFQAENAALRGRMEAIETLIEEITTCMADSQMHTDYKYRVVCRALSRWSSIRRTGDR